MVIIHKERVSVPVPTMEPGTVFFDDYGRLMIVTDDYDSVDGGCSAVDIKSGTIRYYTTGDIAIPCKITTVEVE